MHVQNSSARFDGIQSLRLVAALLVVITHSTFYTHERLNSNIEVWRTGAIGVDIFFLISGFVMLITADRFIISKHGWKEFAARRLLRIAPMYWLATTVKLLTMLAIPSAVLHAKLDIGNVILSYFFLPSRNIDGQFAPLLGVGWTLVFEMFFYALFASALFFPGKFISVCRGYAHRLLLFFLFSATGLACRDNLFQSNSCIFFDWHGNW